MLTTHVCKATQVIEAIYTRHTQLDPPVLESDGTDSDNPDLFGGYAGHCSRSAPRIYAREAPPGLCPDSDGGPEGTPST